MATTERLREVAKLATEHWKWAEGNRNDKNPPENYFRILPGFLTIYISPVEVPLTPWHTKVKMLGPYSRWDKLPTHGPDFDFYRRLLAFFETELGHWAGQDRGHVSRRDGRWNAVVHAAAHEDTDLRWTLQIHPRQIELGAYQDGLVGPGRKNSARWSIETKSYACLAPREQLWWRYVTWRLSRWLEAQGFTNRSEPIFDDPEENIEWRVRNCWHFGGEETIHEPRKRVTNPGRDDRDANGKTIVNGDTKYLVVGGRIMRGRVFYNLNNMWWVVIGGRLHNQASFHLFDWRPGLPRRWFDSYTRSEQVRRALTRAVESEYFERAVVLRDAKKRLLSCGEPKRQYIPGEVSP